MGKQEHSDEMYLSEQIELLGGETRKYTSPGRKGVADRLCFLPRGILYLVEVKTYDGKESPSQIRERHRMQALGFTCRIAYGKAGIDLIIKEMKERLNNERRT